MQHGCRRDGELAMSQLVLTPVGTMSVFGFETPIRVARAQGAALTAEDASAHAAGRKLAEGSAIEPVLSIER
jgi:hypothetical protein